MHWDWPAWSALVFGLFAATCTSTPDAKPACDNDERLCPASPKTATRVACDCSCQLPKVPLGGDIPKFTGQVIACLPPALNAVTGSDDEKSAVASMAQSAYDQAVFSYCSADVAQWLSLTIKSQLVQLAQVPAGMACEPYSCTCTTGGGEAAGGTCTLPCADTPCDDKSCDPILRQNGILQVSTCTCTRTQACGFTSPAHDKPGICRPVANLED
jgi:hypothetical protein